VHVISSLAVDHRDIGETISSGLHRFLAITVLLDVKDIPQVGPLQWGRINRDIGETSMSADQHLTATALITEAPDIMSATVKTRMNYAVPHLLSAAIFSRRLGEIEAEHSGQDLGPFWDEILAHATATVFLAVAGLESYANELFIEMSQNFPGVRQELLEKLWSDYEGKRILEKFDLALLLRGASTRPTGVESFQSVDALVRLRNALMHFKPEWEPARHKRLSSELRSFFKPSEFLASDPGLFPRAWASHKCTVCAVNSVLSFIEHFQDCAGLSHKMAEFSDRLKP